MIEAVWTRFPDQAFHLLRSRIYTNYPLTLRCQGAIKVAAKRVTPMPEGFESLPELAQIDLSPDLKALSPPTQAIQMPAVQGLEPIVSWMRYYPFAGSDRPILAVLVDETSKPVLAALNASSQNRLHHAEVNLIKEYVRLNQRLVPRGYQIIVSLKPCCMCGGFIADLCQDGRDTPVHYLSDDPGPKARTTPLSRMRHI